MVDVMIVGRGGGSIEDLWAFNEEPVARAILDCPVPVISAVGHEIDFTIADFVADYRAPTPSAAAEVAVPDREALLRTVTDLRMRATEAIDRMIEERTRRVLDLQSSYVFRRMDDLIVERWQRMDELEGRLGRALDHFVMGRKARFQGVVGRLEALSPLSALSRGFSVCRKMPQGCVVLDSAELHVGDEVEVTFSRGRARCRVEGTAGNHA
jgi:exodeoxyribonuclease VII large subunit